jgi:TPR repeat protein
MYRCAAEQGNGEAATALGIYLSEGGNYQKALEAFQLGVAAGSSTSASFVYKGFRNPPPTNELHYLGQQEDLERAERYEKIWKVLSGYSYANPKVPEINEILPLPPAKLPAWDGKLQWLEERLANVPPEKPSEALIQQLAKAKLLDPTSGRPLPASPDFIREPYRKLTCNSGQACPQSGYWKAEGIVDEIRRFEKGEMMPTLNVRRSHSRFLLADRITVAEENIEWILFGKA